ncbi:hypothetical protein J6590_101713, partial [Homalodisca vitripennis]
QITTTDGQNLHVTTKDGQMIPLQITSSDGPLEIPVAQDIVDEPISTLEFTAADGQKFKIIPPYISDTTLDAEYLNIA